MVFNESVFRKYDIRGIVGNEINEEFIKKVAKGYYLYLNKNLKKEKLKIAIGYDGRISSPHFSEIMINELLKYGVDIIFIKLVTSPLLYYTVNKYNLDGGLMITASHNPKEFNGIKILMNNFPVYDAELQKLKEYAKSSEEITNKDRGTLENLDIIEVYTDEMKEKFNHLSNYKDLKICIDCGNGAAGVVINRLFKKLNINYYGIFEEVDGNFPNHHPDPTVEKYMAFLKNKITETSSHVGFGFDGDGDRLGVMDEEGKLLGGDQVLYIFAKDILKEKPNSVFVSEVKCSQVLYDNIRKMGGNIIMWLAGHALLKAKMIEVNADLAGEMSGHFFFKHRYYGFDDAIYSMLRFIEILGKNKEKYGNYSINNLLEDWQKTVSTPELRVDFDEKEKFNIAQILEKEFNKDRTKYEIKDIITIDGIRVIFNNGWGLIRASNTQPAIVLRFEANTYEDLEKYKNLFKIKIKEIFNKELNF